MSKPDQLIALWDDTRKGNENAFALLHGELYPGLFSYIRKITRDDDAADDLLQDLFLKFWETSARIGAIRNVKSYFYRAARCTVLNQLKSAQLKMARMEAMPVPDLEFSKEELILSGEVTAALSGKLASAVNRLPEKQREVMYMRFYENMEYTQIAEITGIRYQSVVNHIYRAVQLMRDTLNLKDVYVV